MQVLTLVAQLLSLLDQLTKLVHLAFLEKLSSTLTSMSCCAHTSLKQRKLPRKTKILTAMSLLTTWRQQVSMNHLSVWPWVESTTTC